jgi:hypothetical protein
MSEAKQITEGLIEKYEEIAEKGYEAVEPLVIQYLEGKIKAAAILKSLDIDSINTRSFAIFLGKTVKSVQEEQDSKPVYSHESKRRCKKIAKNYPAFMRKPCNAVLKPEKTINGGSVKVWICPRCKRRERTEGKLV